MKVELLRKTAYAELQVTEEDVLRAPQITPQLRQIARTLQRDGQPRTMRRIEREGRTVFIEDTTFRAPYGPGTDLVTSWPTYLAFSDSPDARAVLDMYSRLDKTIRRWLPIEAFCVAAKVSPIRVLSLLTEVIVRTGGEANTIISSLNQPRVVQKLVDRALDDGSPHTMRSAEILSRATGFLPLPRGAQTNIQVNASAQANAQSITAPPPEQTIRRLTDRFNQIRGLPPATPAALDSPLPDPIEVEAASEEDDVLSS